MGIARRLPLLVALAALGCGSTAAAPGADAAGDNTAIDSPASEVDAPSAVEASPETGGSSDAGADATTLPADASTSDAPPDVYVDAGITTMHGFIIGANLVGSMSVVIGTDQLIGSAGTFPASGLFALPSGTPTAMTGSYDRASTTLTLSGGGYSSNDIVSGWNFHGSFHAPTFQDLFYDVAVDPETTYCGTLQGSTPGVIALAESQVFPQAADSGSPSGATSVDVGLGTAAWVQVYGAFVGQDGGFDCPMSLGVDVQGTIDDDAGSAAGVWTEPGDGGTWTATPGACPAL